MISPTAIRQWLAKRKARQTSLGLNGKNTQRLRGGVRAAKKHKRFFAYLVSLNPCLPLGVFLPLLAIDPATRKFGFDALHTVEAILRVASLLLGSAYIFMQIVWRRRRFLRAQRRALAKAVEES